MFERNINMEAKVSKESSSVNVTELQYSSLLSQVQVIKVYVDLKTGNKYVDYDTACKIGIVNTYDKVSTKAFFYIADSEIRELSKRNFEIMYVELPITLDLEYVVPESIENIDSRLKDYINLLGINTKEQIEDLKEFKERIIKEASEKDDSLNRKI